MKKKLIATLTACILSATILTGCDVNMNFYINNNPVQSEGDTVQDDVVHGDSPDYDRVRPPKGHDTTPGVEPSVVLNDEDSEDIITFTMFSAMPGLELEEGNKVQELIAEKTGVLVKECWLSGQTAAEAVGTMIACGQLPDFIDGGDGMQQLYDTGLLVPWDDYLEKYPNLKELYTEDEWELFRQEDGHIYWANAFCNHYGQDKTTTHNDSAFWIQARVLEWADYPEITTLDEYFDLLEHYYKENKSFTDANGMEVEIIPYTTLCDDWRYFCIESPPIFLDGYPNDGSVIVDTKNMKVNDYNTTPTAERYFRKLNTEYKKGIIDKDFDKQIYDEYIEKLETGAVLGMFDQNWDFNYYVSPVFAVNGLDKLGCDYVPLGLTIDKGMEQRYHLYGDNINSYSGIAVTTSCSDPDRAFRFLNDILSQEIHDLRFWGIEGEDYLIDEDGKYYRTNAMRSVIADTSYQVDHMCPYSYMPQWLGTSRDGINAMQPQEQPSEFMATLPEPVARCLQAYGANNFPDMIGSVEEEPGCWFPMYLYSNYMSAETPGGEAWHNMGVTKHTWLPKLVKARDFDEAWNQYMRAYKNCEPENYLSEMQDELDRRLEMNNK